MKKVILAAVTAFALNVGADELYKKFQPEQTSRRRENIEWSKTYTYNARDLKNPRFMMIGDSICNAYHGAVRARLGKKANASFWATSKCVTDKDYFRELDFILSGYKCDVITFNNGLHSLGTNVKEWEAAYRQAIKFIKAKCPDSKLFIVLSTPLKDPNKTKRAMELNAICMKIAADEKIPVIDLFVPMDRLDRNKFWSDTYHFKSTAVNMQADILANAILSVIGSRAKENIVQQGSETGPSGKIK